VDSHQRLGALLLCNRRDRARLAADLDDVAKTAWVSSAVAAPLRSMIGWCDRRPGVRARQWLSPESPACCSSAATPSAIATAGSAGVDGSLKCRSAHFFIDRHQIGARCRLTSIRCGSHVEQPSARAVNPPPRVNWLWILQHHTSVRPCADSRSGSRRSRLGRGRDQQRVQHEAAAPHPAIAVRNSPVKRHSNGRSSIQSITWAAHLGPAVFASAGRPHKFGQGLQGNPHSASAALSQSPCVETDSERASPTL